jgi:predicted molibdopterin-dependent oxidoreductase YjgC
LKGGEVAALASPWASLEDNWILKRIFQGRWDLRDLAASTLGGLGTGDDILRLPEKYPNASGLRLLDIPTDPSPVLKGMESGRLKAVILLENDVIELGGDRFQVALAKVPQVLLLTPHATAGTSLLPTVVPVRTHAEKDGTFVSAEGRLQRFRRAVEPPAEGILPSSLLLADLARRLGMDGFGFEDTPAVFDALAKEVPALRGTTFRGIPRHGVRLEGEFNAPPPFKNVRVDPNVVPSTAASAAKGGAA